MIRYKFSPRELQQINDFIDDRLTPKKKAAFEARLASSVDLQRYVLEQKRLKASLRALPFIKSPRNFMLTPEMVKQRKVRSGVSFAFSFASAGAAILLMLAFVGEFVFGSNFPFMMQSADAVPEAAMLASVSEKDVVEEPVIIFWGVAPQGKGSGGGMEVMGIGGGDFNAEPELVGIEPGITEEPMLEIAAVPPDENTMGKNDRSIPAGTVILGLPLEDCPDVIEQLSGMQKLAQWVSSFQPLRWVQLSLTTLLVAFGVTAIVYRKKNRR